MPKPGAPHQQLAKLAGNWTGDEKMSPSPWDPAGGTATGKVTNRVALDGFIVVQDYEQTRDGKISFRGHGVFAWDPEQGQTVLHWWDVMTATAQVFTGTWKGDVLTLTNASPMGHSRCTFDLSGGGYRFAMDFSQDGTSWATLMSGSYRKS